MTNPYILPVILLLIGLAAILAGLELYRNLRAENQTLRRDVGEMRDRVTRLETANMIRVNVKTLEELENAMAELTVLEMENDLKGERISSIREHLSKAHTPNSKKQ